MTIEELRARVVSLVTDPRECAALLASLDVAERARSYADDTGSCVFCTPDSEEDHETHCTEVAAFSAALDA